jgi:V8-like Glu-specific endopeptidase
MVSANGTPMMGTGWLCGDSTLVTAGHCVYNHDSRYGVGAMRKITVYAGRNKDIWQGDAIATSTNTTKEWVTAGSQANDYAAIQLSKPLGQQLKFFQFAEFPDLDLQNLLVNIAGYPGDKNRSIYGTMWGSVNKITSISDQRLSYLVDTTGGQSGSPVMAFDGISTHYAIGIHNYGGASSNFATRINSQVFEKISGWVK